MAEETKKGPVKPPILDAKPAAKTAGPKSTSPSSAQKPGADAAPKKPDPKPKNGAGASSATLPKTEKQRPYLSLPTLVLATILGAALGTGVTSFLAFNNISPFEKGTSTSQFNAAMETLQKRVFDLENAPKPDLSAFANKDQLNSFASNDALTSLQAQLSATSDQMGELAQTVANNAKNISTGNAPSLDPAVVGQIKAEIDGLKASILELSPDNALALEAQLEQNQKLAAALTQILALEANQTTNEEALSDLEQQVDEITQTLADLNTQVGAAPDQSATSANLPIILDAWEKTLRSGTAYTDYVLAAASILPQLEPSQSQLAFAQTGVSTPASLQADFANLIPAFIKSDTELAQDASWLDRLSAQAKSAIGLRPLDQTGEQPMALVARIEAALAQEDLQVAHTNFTRLPKEWQDLSQDFAKQLSATSAANDQLETAKQMALNLATQPQGASQ